MGTNPGSIARPSPLLRALRYCFPHSGIGSATSNRSISGLILPFTYVPAYTLPVYASQGVLPHHHARLGTRLLARLYRGSHLRLLNSMRFQGATRTDPGVQYSRTGFLGCTRVRAKLEHQANTRRHLASVMRGRTTFMRSRTWVKVSQLKLRRLPPRRLSHWNAQFMAHS